MTGSIAGAGEPAALGTVELRSLQTRDFQSSKGAVFASVMTVLLDTGYRVQSADLESGLITAGGSSTARLRLDPTGLSRASLTPVASAYVEDRGDGSARVRIVFSLGTTATGALAAGGERAVLDRAVYDAFFAQLEREIEQRPAPLRPAAEPAPVRAADPAAPGPSPAVDAAEPEPEPEPQAETESESQSEPGSEDPEVSTAALSEPA